MEEVLMTKEKLVKKMNDILAELSDMNDETITDSNYREYYERAANEIDLNDDEDDYGELDIFRFNFEHCDTYCDLRHKLREILVEEGLTIEERKEFYKTNLVGNV